MTVRSRLAAAGVLVLSGAAAIAHGLSVESARSAAAEPRHAADRQTAVLTTPLLSARRVPDYLVRPQAGRRLAARLGPLVATAPPQTCVVVAEGGTTLFSAKPDEPMPAASNQKLVTALTALDVFGPDATFTTRLTAAAKPGADGVVNGDLWFVGGGDPVIDTDTYQSTFRYGRTDHTRLEDVADRVVAAGVRQITGSVKGDDSYFDAVRTIPTWPSRYLSQNQVGPLSALSVNDARTYPAVAGAGGGTPQPAADPPAYAAAALTQLLAVRGVTVGGLPGSGTAPPGNVELLAVDSLPVSAIVKEMLTFSDNNTAELLLKDIGMQTRGKGTTAAGLEAARATLEKAGLDTEDVVLLDGSGLDTGNRVTCRLLESVLGVAGPTGPLADGLAVADGPVGTLRDRFTNSPAAGAVRAKTGTLKAVTALSGWVRTAKGHDVRFSTIVNTGGRDVAGSDLTFEAKVAEALMSYPDAVDPALVGPR